MVGNYCLLLHHENLFLLQDEKQQLHDQKENVLCDLQLYKDVISFKIYYCKKADLIKILNTTYNIQGYSMFYILHMHIYHHVCTLTVKI